jgi:hypothetical protein
MQAGAGRTGKTGEEVWEASKQYKNRRSINMVLKFFCFRKMRAQLLLCIVIGTCWLGVHAIPDPKFFLIETKGNTNLLQTLKGQ